MKQTTVVFFISIIMLVALSPAMSARDAGVITDQEVVEISLATKGLNVVESIKVTNTGTQNVTSLRFWIQQNAFDLKIREKVSGQELVPLTEGNIRTCNLSAANLTIAPAESRSLEVTYFLPTTEQNFIQTLLYDTTSLTVTYLEGSNQWSLFQGEHLLYGSDVNNALQIRLYKPTEAPLNIMIILIVLAVVVLVLASMLLLLKKQRRKTKKAVVESEETLTTKKSLLLELLKDLEKQYRAKAISSETYTKLKEEYKAQAVDALKKLEDLKK